jgi:putative hydrolase of the HAD superfamily
MFILLGLLLSFGVAPDKIPDGMWQQYLRICPIKTHLMPGAIETLEYMKDKYSLSIITNGFKEVQHFKLKHAGLAPYFNHVIISEETGFQKPHRGIFEHALSLVGGKPEEAMMIGDNLETDIGGAMQSDWEAIWYNPYKNPAPMWIRRQIIALPELTFLL